MPLSADIAAYLETQGLGTVNVDIFAVPFPHDAPEAAVAVVEFPGQYEGVFGSSLNATAFEEGDFSVLIRGAVNALEAARMKAEAIRAKLHRLGPIDLSGKRYHDVKASTVGFLRYDENSRGLFHLRCSVEKDA